eukprot:CAMPEP_0114238926 /NCGR_PEP_ID=MMETSP0058-20121206/8179_1 /TAXON_ID=36894 /ORGANISM="Pyramimonas parkeae, CCMP726" /LENGTH=230 /DNA_ID=CAMNT_0001351057 /DNA_START=154 /DNA_END=846 /DNA_ORIENTATION=+
MDATKCITQAFAGEGIQEGCMGAILSKVLGYAVVAGSAALKLPQILSIVASKSVEGISRPSIEAETIGYFIAMAYSMVRGMSFNAYGETVFLLLQDILVLSLITVYGDKNYMRMVLCLVGVGTIGVCFHQKVASDSALEYAYSGMNTIFYYARVQQIWDSFKAGATGQLSLMSSALMLVGNMVRVLTTIQEGGGTNMLAGYTISLILNLTIVLQILYYGRKKKKANDKTM